MELKKKLKSNIKIGSNEKSHLKRQSVIQKVSLVESNSCIGSGESLWCSLVASTLMRERWSLESKAPSNCNKKSTMNNEWK